MKISVVIPVLNEESTIPFAIDHAWLAGAEEVIVVDGGSDDDTCVLAAEKRCLLVNGSRGRGQQMNLGAAKAKGDVLLFLHSDNSLPPQSLAQISRAMESPACIGGGFRQRLNSTRWIYRIIELGNVFRARHQRLVYGDQGLFVRRDHFESLGGFAEIALMEDYEFAQRCFRNHRPVLLDGPLHVDVRRWEKAGPVRTTWKNWRIAKAWRSGVDADELYRRYYDC